MCGRYTLKTSPRAIAQFFGLAQVPDIEPRFNIAPTQSVLVVRNVDGGPQAAQLRWGLVPSWAVDPAVGNRMINARSDTVATKPAYRAAFKKRRCLIVADGFYEWQKLDARRKQPWYFQLADGLPFGFAGLWECWSGPDGPLETCTILTTDANDLVAPVHARMPVIIPPERHDVWLDPQVATAGPLQSLLMPYPPGEMQGCRVSTRVNSPQHDGPDLVVTVAATD